MFPRDPWRSRQKSAGPVVQHTQYRLQSSESQKLHNWKLNLIYSAALSWEGHSSFSEFHNGNSSLFILPNYILTLENYIIRAVTSLNNCQSKTFCNALWCLPKQAIQSLKTEFHDRKIGSYEIFWGVLFSSDLRYKSSCNTCWLKTYHVFHLSFWISHWKPGPDSKTDHENWPELRAFVFGLVGVNRMFSLSKKLDESCILDLKCLALISQFNLWTELMQTQYSAGNIRDWASRAGHNCLWFIGQVG